MGFVKAGASFLYEDRNSRRTSGCEEYGYGRDANKQCFVLGTHEGKTGWIPVQESAWGYITDEKKDRQCHESEVFSSLTTMFVSDTTEDGTGCAERNQDGCFPADASVVLRSGAVVPMSALSLGDEVAVRRADGSLAYEPVYVFGHKDDVTLSSFVKLVLRDSRGNTRKLQVRVWAGAA